MGIKFGTDGWRATLNNDFNKENVERVTLAIGKYVKDTFGLSKRILVGYDPRNKAKEFSEYCASILVKKGFTVELSERVVPTPVLAYNALKKDACAVMFTASHNPPEYLGMKFIPDYAGPATSDITDKIVNNIDKPLCDELNGKLRIVDFAPEYNIQIDKIIDFEKIQNLKTKIIFDGLYSASIGYFDKILSDNKVPFEAMHMVHDTNFGGGMPDPKPKYLQDLINEVKNNVNCVGLANDGDADRFGVINEKGEYVSPNEVIAILAIYLMNKGLRGSIVKTVGSSILIDVIADKLGLNVIETAVGFKHVGEAMRTNKVIIGGEESGGLSIQGHIPEKDGLLANLLILEAMGATGKSLCELQEELYSIAGTKFYTDRIDKKFENQNDIVPIIDKAKTIQNIGKYNVTGIDTKDGVKLEIGKTAKILVRPSGTEPLLRIYFETDSMEKLDYLKNNFNI